MVRDLEDLDRILGRRELVLLLVYDSRTPIGKYASGLADSIAYTIEPMISLAKMDISRDRALEEAYANTSTPRFQLFYNGRVIWEQIGLFMSYGSDKYAIRRGILRALRRYNLRLKRT